MGKAVTAARQPDATAGTEEPEIWAKNPRSGPGYRNSLGPGVTGGG